MEKKYEEFLGQFVRLEWHHHSVNAIQGEFCTTASGRYYIEIQGVRFYLDSTDNPPVVVPLDVPEPESVGRVVSGRARNSLHSSGVRQFFTKVIREENNRNCCWVGSKTGALYCWSEIQNVILHPELELPEPQKD